jgi:hypothetical protein
VLVIGHMQADYAFVVCRMERFGAREEPERILAEVAARCRQFQVRWIAADGGGNGHVYNRLLWDKLTHPQGLYAIHYSQADSQPVRDGVLTRWTVHRSATIGALLGRVKKRKILFPRPRDVGSFLDEFACEVAAYDEAQRSIRYTHPETQPDDALHATNYALLLATRQYQAAASLAA